MLEEGWRRLEEFRDSFSISYIISDLALSTITPNIFYKGSVAVMDKLPINYSNQKNTDVINDVE